MEKQFVRIAKRLVENSFRSETFDLLRNRISRNGHSIGPMNSVQQTQTDGSTDSFAFVSPSVNVCRWTFVVRNFFGIVDVRHDQTFEFDRRDFLTNEKTKIFFDFFAARKSRFFSYRSNEKLFLVRSRCTGRLIDRSFVLAERKRFSSVFRKEKKSERKFPTNHR